MSAAITGGCLCGGVRYQLTQAPVWAHNCHCSRCRKISGSAFAANLFLPREALRYLQGEDLRKSFELPEAESFSHVFCARCGSSLPFPSRQPGLVGIPMGGLDGDPDFAPRAHIFVDSKAPWFSITDALPQHPEGLGSADAARK
jgi:hypothetical protein